MRPFGLGLTAPRLPEHLDMADGLVDGGFQVGKIDRLDEKVEGAAFMAVRMLLMSP